MPDFHCPGQDQRYWKPEDIFDVLCPRCGKARMHRYVLPPVPLATGPPGRAE